MHSLRRLSKALLFCPRFRFCSYRDPDNFQASVKPTYTSKYFQISRNDILEYLKERQLDFKIRGNSAQLRECPFCPRKNHYDSTNQYTLGVNLSNGSYNCFRASCGAKGSWFDFKNYQNGTLQPDTVQSQTNPPPSNQKINLFEFHIYHERLKLREPVEAYTYLTGDDWDLNHRGLRDDVLKQYHVGIDSQEIFDPGAGTYIESPLVYFPNFRLKTPDERHKWKQKQLKQKFRETMEGKQSQQPTWFDTDYYELVSCKIRGAGANLKFYQRLEPAQAAKGIFGLHLLRPESKQLIITEGEFDAMAAYQMTGIPAISLPNGIQHLPAYLVEWLDQYEHLKDILIWVDDDEIGRMNAHKFAKKLGLARTRVIQPSSISKERYPKDANDALRFFESEVPKFIEQATCLMRSNIATLWDFKQVTRNRMLNIEQGKGVPAQTFHTYNHTTKGLRQGEFSIITGPTGCGKTTFLSQLSLEFCKQGVTTLWGSFEIKADRLAEHMLLQAYKTNLHKHPELIDFAMHRFQRELSMYFMNFYGSTNIDTVIDTIEYAIYEYGITHVCLDNLQFMMGTQAQGIRKFDIQDEIIEKFRKLATNNDIHLTLVIHPKKVDESEDLTIASVFGSAKATQEADNVFILQSRPRYRVFEVRKNRYDGETGRVGFGFDSSIKCFFELTSEEVRSLNEEKATIHQIIEKRQKEGKHFKQEITLADKPNDPNDGGGEGGSAGGVSGQSGGLAEGATSGALKSKAAKDQNFATLSVSQPVYLSFKKTEYYQEEDLDESLSNESQISEAPDIAQIEDLLETEAKQEQSFVVRQGTESSLSVSEKFKECWDYDDQFKLRLEPFKEPEIVEEVPPEAHEFAVVREKPAVQNIEEFDDQIEEQSPLARHQVQLRQKFKYKAH